MHTWLALQLQDRNTISNVAVAGLAWHQSLAGHQSDMGAHVAGQQSESAHVAGPQSETAHVAPPAEGIGALPGEGGPRRAFLRCRSPRDSFIAAGAIRIFANMMA